LALHNYNGPAELRLSLYNFWFHLTPFVFCVLGALYQFTRSW